MSNTFDRVREIGREEGRELGKIDGMCESAKVMLKKGIIGIDKISDLFPELTEADISAIKAKLV